jgi:hypothetical protein
MATSKPKSTRLHTPRGIAAYVNLHTPRQRTDRKGQPTGDPKYGLALFFDEDTDISELLAVAHRKAVEAFGPTAKALIAKGKIGWPFADTADMDDPSPPFDKPGTVVNFKTADKPGIVDENAEPLMDKSDIYSGMEARVSCRCFSYDNESKGISFALVNVQKLGDGERMSGNPAAEDDFADAKPSKTAKRGAAPAGKVRRSSQDIEDLL